MSTTTGPTTVRKGQMSEMFVLITNESAVIFSRTTAGVERYRRIDGRPERLRRVVSSVRACWLEGALPLGLDPGVFRDHAFKPVAKGGVPLRLLPQDGVDSLLGDIDLSGAKGGA